MKRQALKLLGITALGAGLALAQAPAQNPGQSPAQVPSNGQTSQQARHGRFRARVAQQLNLTPEQKQQAKAIRQQAAEAAKPLMQQSRQNRQELQAAVKADDTAKIQELSSMQGQLRGQILAIHANAKAKFYQMLTPEQRTKADQLRTQWQSRRQHVG